jgi:dihydrofolate reductase
MRKLIYPVMVTLDGFLGGPKGELDWHITTPEMHRVYNDLQRGYGGYVMGRQTYDVMRAWDNVPDDHEQPEMGDFARVWKETPKLVLSRTLREVGPNAQLAGTDPEVEIRDLKRQDGRVLVVAGTEIGAWLRPLGLIDEYELFVHPVLLGSGTRLFPEGLPRVATRLLEATVYPSGVVRARYALDVPPPEPVRYG